MGTGVEVGFGTGFSVGRGLGVSVGGNWVGIGRRVGPAFGVTLVAEGLISNLATTGVLRVTASICSSLPPPQATNMTIHTRDKSGQYADLKFISMQSAYPLSVGVSLYLSTPLV